MRFIKHVKIFDYVSKKFKLQNTDIVYNHQLKNTIANYPTSSPKIGLQSLLDGSS